MELDSEQHPQFEEYNAEEHNDTGWAQTGAICDRAELQELLRSEIVRALDEWYERLAADKNLFGLPLITATREVEPRGNWKTSPLGEPESGGGTPALKGHDHRPATPAGGASPRVLAGESTLDTEVPVNSFATEHFASLARSKSKILSERFGGAPKSWRRLISLLPAWEPDENATLTRIVTSEKFENLLRAAIFLNCIFMAYLANEQIKNWDQTSVVAVAIELGFLVIYTIEVALKLIVYRWWYFASPLNCYDILLVAIDVSDHLSRFMVSNVFNTSYLRVLRVLKVGKALRAVRVAGAFEKLKAFLICFHGSMGSLAWSLVMLGMILYMFSLCIVQIVAIYFRDQGEMISRAERSELENLFGSVELSMLTLFQLTTDGLEWRDPFEALSRTGWLGTAMFITFVAFTQLAVINVITGIFVESAMQNLAPDRETMAMEHQFREHQAAGELAELCSAEDESGMGMLSPAGFECVLVAGRLPRLMHMLGLRENHVRQFFKFLSDANATREVDIQDFVRGCMRLRGSATNFDLHLLQIEVSGIRKMLLDLAARRTTSTVNLSPPSAEV